jgi:hypothetical protein
MVSAIATVGTGGPGNPVSIGGFGSAGNYNISFEGNISSDGITAMQFNGSAQI